MTTSDHMSGCFESSYTTEDHRKTGAFEVDDNWSDIDGNGQSEQQEGRGEEEIDMRLIDFQLDDALGSSCYHPPFDIAQEMMEPMEQEHNGDEPPMLAFRSGVPAVATCGYDMPSNLREEEKRDGKGKYVKEEVQEVVGIPHAPTERPSSSPSSLSKEGGELSLWSSLDLPPICFNII
ncbi:PREDICTED: uncharacterized protein LOC105119401 [Populus euphratica]|uniref:Uncharacterized protein LOC105119401 n=1 Tax=Populus euphratica TaxID=75702 RepID=A0AAJ6XEN9_POPEU|nr:PREDICTED: uncharacterized protein LOC105119401 [Populus euphratica]